MNICKEEEFVENLRRNTKATKVLKNNMSICTVGISVTYIYLGNENCFLDTIPAAMPQLPQYTFCFLTWLIRVLNIFSDSSNIFFTAVH